MAFEAFFALLMLLVIASWVTALVVGALVARSLLLPAGGRGRLDVVVIDDIEAAERAGEQWQAGIRLGCDPRSLALMASTSWWAPPLVATALALISLPLVAHSLSILDTSTAVSSSSPFLADSDPRRWTAGAGSVVLSALVAGAIGAPAVRRRLVAGALFTFILALITAIAAFPIVPATAGDHVGEVIFCIDSCSAIINSSDPSSGLHAAPLFAWAVLSEPIAVAVLAAGVSLWSLLVRRLSDAASLAARTRWP